MVVLKNTLIRQPADPVQYNTSEGILPYFGEDNNFPLRLAKLVQDSPTASACISTISDFIEGGGFSDEDLEDVKVNSQGLRFGDLHAGISDSFALYEGFAINVRYSRNGKITELYPVPFENCRFSKPDSKGVISKIRVNSFFGTSLFKSQHTRDYDTFNPNPDIVKKQIANEGRAYKGQILYIGKPRPLSPYYPRPHYMSCEKWMSVDSSIGEFHKNNIENRFSVSTLIKMIGDENAPSTHPDDKKWNETTQTYEVPPENTVGRRFNIEMQKFTGSDRAGNSMALWAASKDAAPELEPFQASTNDQLFTVLQNITTENITRATKVPSILANIQTGASLGGDGNQLRAAIKIMQQRVVRVHGMLERTYTMIFEASEGLNTGEVKILHHNPFPEQQTVDPNIWKDLPQKTKLKWIMKNTEFEIDPAELEAEQPQPTAPQTEPTNKFSNALHTSYPQEARENAKRARKFYEDTESACGSRAGWVINQTIIDGQPISYESIKRIYRFLKKKEAFKDHLFSDSCDSVLYAAWGGVGMANWAASKINDTEK